MNIKKVVGEKSVEYIKDGMTVGLGTGSTAYWAIKRIGDLIKEGLKIKAVPTSHNTEELARELGIKIVDFSKVKKIDVTIDGADEFDDDLNLIKGGGGALLREKLVAFNSDKVIIIVDESKYVKKLGKYPLPVEVNPFGWEATDKHLKRLGSVTRLRINGGNPFITDNGNFIIDCRFDEIPNPSTLGREVNMIPGVVENGLFINIADIVLMGEKSGAISVFNR